MGGFDLIRTVDGELVFLKVNEQGQWLFLETNNPNLRIANRFTNFLLDLLPDQDADDLDFSADYLTAECIRDPGFVNLFNRINPGEN